MNSPITSDDLRTLGDLARDIIENRDASENVKERAAHIAAHIAVLRMRLEETMPAEAVSPAEPPTFTLRAFTPAQEDEHPTED